jgi:hypothetical protein
MSLNTEMLVSIVADLNKGIDLASGTAKLQMNQRTETKDGKGAGQADQIFTDKRTIFAGGHEDIDLFGALKNIFGDYLSFADVKGLVVISSPENVDRIKVGGAPSQAVAGFFADSSDALHVRPGGMLVLAQPSGVAVLGNQRMIRVENTALFNSAEYEIYILGAADALEAP